MRNTFRSFEKVAPFVTSLFFFSVHGCTTAPSSRQPPVRYENASSEHKGDREPTDAAPNAGSVEVYDERRLWGEIIRKTPLPSKGCFTASYPSLTWKPVACVAPPKKGPYSPRHFPRPANAGGNSYDFAAQAPPQGIISYAEGSFDNVTTTGEINRNDAGVYSTKSQYSLQLNTNPFSTPMCAHAPLKNCTGWQQFVLSNDPGSPPAWAFVEYFLLGYGKPCPLGWTQSDDDCTVLSMATAFPAQSSIQSLSGMILTASVTPNGNDTFIIENSTDIVSALSSDSVLTLAGHWTIAEFNVFGDLSVHTAVFDPGTSIVARVTTGILENGPAAAPAPDLVAYTAESNNLNLIQPACSYTYPFYAVTFMESNVPGASFSCLTKDRCRESKAIIASDQRAIANEEKALNTARCHGAAGMECHLFLKSLKARLKFDTASEQTECNG